MRPCLWYNIQKRHQTGDAIAMPNKFIDLTGNQYENYTVLRKGSGRYTKGGQYKVTWVCRCTCGKEFEADGEKIRHGKVYSCGCKRYAGRDRFYEDLTGKQFGRLTVIRRLKPEEITTRQYNWLCKCTCGAEVKASANKLKTGHTRSCGCLKNEFSIGAVTRTHGKTQTRLYHVHASMKRRCYAPKTASYKYYGARGIRVCDEWLGEHGFENFYQWAMAAGYDENKPAKDQSIDRIDVNGNYEPGNCRWADSRTQNLNKRKK